LIAIFTNFPPNVKDSKAHQGFLGTYIFIRQNLLKSILALPRKPIIVTGHSRGAAVATFVKK
jgi:type IV secretory pathway protease TraF